MPLSTPTWTHTGRGAHAPAVPCLRLRPGAPLGRGHALRPRRPRPQADEPPAPDAPVPLQVDLADPEPEELRRPLAVGDPAARQRDPDREAGGAGIGVDPDRESAIAVEE